MKNLVKLLSLIIILIFWGCKENSTEPSTQIELSSTTEEAAYNVTTQLSSDASGAVDQIGDAFTLAFPTSLNRVVSNDKDTTFKSKVWDDVNKIWTITVDRNFTNIFTGKNFYFKRTYTLQYLNKNNEPIKFWKVANDTAYTIKFKILNGQSYFQNPIITHRLLSLTADLTITNANKQTVIINGTMRRTGADTIKVRNIEKTHNYTLDLNFQDVSGPKKNKLNLENKLSGTITGTYTAIVTKKTGDIIEENQITKNIEIKLDGTGNYDLKMYGKNNEFKARGNLFVPGITKK